MIKQLARLINRYIRAHWPFLAAVLVLQTTAAIMSLYLPTLNARIIDQGVVTGDTEYIWSAGLTMLAFAGVQAVAQISAVWAAANAAMRLGRDVRAALFNRVLTFSSQELNRFGAPTLLTRNTNDVQQVQVLVLMTCVMLVSAPVTMAGGVFLAVTEEAGMSWIILVAVTLLGIGLGIITSFTGPLFKLMQTRVDAINRVLREQITGIRVVRAFAREQQESRRFNRANAELSDTALKVGRLMSTLFPYVGLIIGITTVAVLWFGSHRIAQGHLQIGQLTAFISYSIQILIAVMISSLVLTMLPRAAVSADRILEVLDTPSSVVEPDSPSPAPAATGMVVFDEVTFSYPGAEYPILRKVSFTAQPGKTTAIIGSTGAGKTTLVSLVPRLFDVTGGRVLVDGLDVGDYALADLWQRIGIVEQRPYLFSGTVGSNLRYGKPDATADQMWQALEIAQAKDFVSAKAGGLETEVSQGGTNLSGGQRQRLAIARALVKQPKIYIFDDSFSALDVATDARLRLALAQHIKDATVIVVAQRVATIRDADQIVVLDDGVSVGQGTHDELLASCATYREIVESQSHMQEAQ